VALLFDDIKKEFPGKPILAVCPLGERKIYLELRQGFQDIGIPCYTGDADAIATLAALYRYRRYVLGAD
jgi:acyl-CoA synthetase (NDP forming)